MATPTKQYTISIPDRPGTFANVVETLSKAGINIEGGLEYSHSGTGYLSFVTNNPSSTESTLNTAGIKYTTHEVVVTKLNNKPGSLAQITRAFAQKNINITSFYVLIGGQVAFGVDNPKAAWQVAKDLGVSTN